MERKDYIELYKKQPNEIISRVTQDMLETIPHIKADDNMLDKITEWRYILMQAEKSIINSCKIPKELI